MDGSILDISPAVVWVIALSQLLTFALTVWNLISSGSRANARTLEEHGRKMTGLDNRISTIEVTLQEIPERQDFHQLEVRMTELTGTMQVLTERMRPLESITDRMQEIMLDQGRRGGSR
ncbi:MULTISPECIES: DUF2730 family protein [unclassified Marinovum]|uniref:DUF2730 family protein n=1 Tax=unclassified Marinovum TaxID=2647166 RepID=UPI003EDBAD61